METLMKRHESYRPEGVLSVFSVPRAPGAVYVEAWSARHAMDLCRDVSRVKALPEPFQVPLEECVPLLRMPRYSSLSLGSWVRIVKPKLYQGDLAYVDSSDDCRVTVYVVPRLTESIFLGKRKSQRSSVRPPARLLDVRTAQENDCAWVRGSCFEFKRKAYKDGFLQLVLPLTDLIQDGVQPSYQELEIFRNLTILTDSSIKTALTDLSIAAFSPGDRVKIILGAQKNLTAEVISVGTDNVQVEYSEGKQPGIKLQVPAVFLRKHFNIGDQVRVRHGINAGLVGWVLQLVGDNEIFILSHSSKEEVCTIRFN